MKNVYFIRHAKSSWAFDVASDFERPLNDRGNQDAPTMAQKLFSQNILIDAFVSSTAKRAISTAQYFANQYNSNQIIEVGSLYHPVIDTFFTVIESLNNSFNNVAIFSHNPTITEMVNELTEVKIDDMPTCGVFGVQANCNHWQEFKKAKKTFLFFYYPKM